jgi:hypothetical protein
MTIVDPVQPVLEASVAILDADADLRTLFARTTDIVIPWDTLKVETTLPVICYLPATFVPLYHRVARLAMQFACFSPSRAVANSAMQGVLQALTTPAFALRGLEVSRDPDVPPVRQWPTADPVMSDTAEWRADLLVSFLIPG